jgi:Ala-tRNA(Pro) deacylase
MQDGLNEAVGFFRILEELGIASQTVEHEAVFTAEGLAKRESSQWEFPVKNILIEDKGKRLFLVTMHLLTPPLDLKALAKTLGANGRFSFASAQTLGASLKVLPGSVTPFALVNDRQRIVNAVLDARMRLAQTVSAHPLVNTMTATIAVSDLLRLFDYSGHRPVWCDLPVKAAG